MRAKTYDVIKLHRIVGCGELQSVEQYYLSNNISASELGVVRKVDDICTLNKFNFGIS